MFLPQTPFCPSGSLQYNLTYPERHAQPMDPEKLRELLAAVNLEVSATACYRRFSLGCKLFLATHADGCRCVAAPT